MYCNIKHFCVLNQPGNRNNTDAIFCTLPQNINLEISNFHTVKETRILISPIQNCTYTFSFHKLTI